MAGRRKAYSVGVKADQRRRRHRRHDGLFSPVYAARLDSNTWLNYTWVEANGATLFLVYVKYIDNTHKLYVFTLAEVVGGIRTKAVVLLLNSSKSMSSVLAVVAYVHFVFALLLFSSWLYRYELSPSDLLVYYFAFYFPAYVALLLKANITYRAEALPPQWELYLILLPAVVVIAGRPAWWSAAFSLVFLLSFSLALSLSFFLEDLRRGKVERVDVAGLVLGLVGLLTFHVTYFFVVMLRAAGEAFDDATAAFWYFAMFPVLFYVYSAVRLALGRSCPAPLALAAIAYGISAAVDNFVLLSTAALAIPVAMACKKDSDKAA